MGKRKPAGRRPSLDNLAVEAGRMFLEEVGGLFAALFESGQASGPPPVPKPRTWDAPADVLGVASNAPRVVVDAAFRVQAAAAHPDRADGDADRFKALTAARDTLYKLRGWK
jgi:hypothetical protein